MTGPSIKAQPKPKHERERDYELKGRQLHKFEDPGPPIAEKDFQPGIFGKPDEALALIFAGLGRDYGGPLAPVSSPTEPLSAAS